MLQAHLGWRASDQTFYSTVDAFSYNKGIKDTMPFFLYASFFFASTKKEGRIMRLKELHSPEKPNRAEKWDNDNDSKKSFLRNHTKREFLLLPREKHPIFILMVNKQRFRRRAPFSAANSYWS
jgi:hypothetical protein